MICVLEVLRGPAKRSRYVLRDKEHFEIGRSIGVDIYLPSDVHLSRRHLLIAGTGDHFSIRDLGSSNGTYLNDQRVKTAVLESGDILRVGATAFRVALLPDDVNPHAQDGVSFSEGNLHSIDFPVYDSVAEAERYPTVHQGSLVDWSGFDRERNTGSNLLDAEEVRFTGDRLQKSTTLLSIRNHYFSSIGISNLYELSHPVESPWGAYLGILLRLSLARPITVIFNLDRLGGVEADLLRKKEAQGDVVRLSQGIVMCRLALSDGNLRFLSGSIGRDAMVCLGSSEHLDLKKFSPYSDIFSSPSAFGSEIRKPASKVAFFLLKQHAWALFEWSIHGPVGLFIDF